MRNIIALSLILLVCGCGENVPLSGKVVFSDTDEPLTCGMVGFVQPAFMARGIIDENGHYVVGSHKTKDGLPPGTYRVCVYSTRHTAAGTIPLIDEKYSDPDRTDIAVDVDKSTKTFDIKVDRFSFAARKR